MARKNRSRQGASDVPDAIEKRSNVDAFLEKVAHMPPTENRSRRGRLLFGMDATMSRQPSWDRACQIQGDMFLETAAIGGLSVQLAFFRGHNEFKVSKWVDSPEHLLKLMSSVRCRGGFTKIERLLKYAIDETRSTPVDAVVYVGDCCEEEADRLCQYAGELGIRRTPLFMFQEGHDPTAAIAFREMAKLSRGAYCAFDPTSPQQLRDLLRAVAVYASGGAKALESHAQKSGAGAIRLLEQLT